MTTIRDDIQRLRARIGDLELLAELEQDAAEAKAAYQADPDNEKLKKAHRAAGQALADHREQTRADRAEQLAVTGPDGDGGTTVAPGSANGTGNPGKVG